jgi:anti-anti-sigma regulatory factor
MLLVKLKEKFLIKDLNKISNIVTYDQDLIFDMNDVKEIDSASIGLIVYYHTTFQKKKKKFLIYLYIKDNLFSQFLKQTGLDTVLNIIEKLPEEPINEIFYDQRKY